MKIDIVEDIKIMFELVKEREATEAEIIKIGNDLLDNEYLWETINGQIQETIKELIKD
jgi:hypothetical protein